MSLQTTLKSSAAAVRVDQARTDNRAHTDDQPAENRKPVELPPSLNRDRILDSAQTALFFGMSLAHFRRLYRARRVPSPIMIGYRKYGWQVGVLVDFIGAKTEKSAA